MKKYFALFSFICVITVSCNTTPEKYFDVTILNTNLLNGFANNGQLRELESPSVMFVKTQAEPVVMQRKQVIDDKIKFVEETLSKIKDLNETAETKEIIQASITLFEYVLPVYKNDYKQLAELYDNNASSELIQAKASMIQDKYAEKFGELHTKLIDAGKIYATKHDIKVNWDIRTSPNLFVPFFDVYFY